MSKPVAHNSCCFTELLRRITRAPKTAQHPPFAESTDSQVTRLHSGCVQVLHPSQMLKPFDRSSFIYVLRHESTACGVLCRTNRTWQWVRDRGETGSCCATFAPAVVEQCSLRIDVLCGRQVGCLHKCNRQYLSGKPGFAQDTCRSAWPVSGCSVLAETKPGVLPAGRHGHWHNRRAGRQGTLHHCHQWPRVLALQGSDAVTAVRHPSPLPAPCVIAAAAVPGLLRRVWPDVERAQRTMSVGLSSMDSLNP